MKRESKKYPTVPVTEVVFASDAHAAAGLFGRSMLSGQGRDHTYTILPLCGNKVKCSWEDGCTCPDEPPDELPTSPSELIPELRRLADEIERIWRSGR